MLGLLNDKDTATLRQQAYLATRAALNTQGRAGTPENIMVSKIAEAYVKGARSRLSSPITATQIQADPEFRTLVGQGAGGGWGLQDQLIDGVPNYFLYGGAAALGALVFWPRKGAKSGAKKRKKSKSVRAHGRKAHAR